MPSLRISFIVPLIACGYVAFCGVIGHKARRNFAASNNELVV
jgi:hypothetical protein